jgi:hypothetical protein
MNWRKAKGLANHSGPALQLFQFSGPDQFPVIFMAPVTPDLAVKDQLPMGRRVQPSAAFGANDHRIAMPPPDYWKVGSFLSNIFLTIYLFKSIV